MKEWKYVVRNRILTLTLTLTRRGAAAAALIEGQYLELQTDTGLGVRGK